MEGSCKKRRKKMVDEAHGDSVLLSQVKSETVILQPSIGIGTFSEADCALNALEHDSAEVWNQTKCSSGLNDPLQIPDSASFKPLSEHDLVDVQNQVECSSTPKGPLQVTYGGGGAAEVMVNNGTQGAESSSKDRALINVEGYCVKKEVALMLQRIFDKYKDITRDCKINDRTILVPILEMICSFCQKLENLSLNIMDTELEDMISIVEHFWLMGFDVKWLYERLKHLLKDSLVLKEDRTKIELKEQDVDILKQKLSTAETELEMMKAANYKARCKFEQQHMTVNLEGFLPNINPTEGRAAKAAQAVVERQKSVEVNPSTLPVQQSSSSRADRMTTDDMNSTDVRMAKLTRANAEREGRALPLYQLDCFDALKRRAAKYAQVKAEGEKCARVLTKTVEVNPSTLPVQQSSSSGADGMTTADMYLTDGWMAMSLSQSSMNAYAKKHAQVKAEREP